MKLKRFAIPMVLVAGVLLGVVATGLLNWPSNGNASNTIAVSESENAAVVKPLVAPDPGLIIKLNDSFISIAETVKPCVVTIFTSRVVEGVAQPFGRLPENHPFNDFFERFFPQRPEDRERQVRGLGSGVIVKEEGYILTNHHVIRGADKIQVMLSDGTKKVDGEIVGTDAKTDLAVLKIDADGLQTLKLGKSANLRVGEWVLAVGSPLSENLARTVTSGIVSATGRSNVGLADYEDFIQTDAAINPGNSGGALVNLHGELVGINTAIATQTGGFQGIGFAVPIDMARLVMTALIDKGKVVRGWLGIYIQNIDQNIASAMNLSTTEGALVSSVTENSPAEEAGIESGDVIVALDGETVTKVTQLRNEVASRAPDTKVTVTVLRDGEKKKIEVTLGQLPEEEATPQMQKSSFDKLGFSVQTLTDDLANRLGYDASEKGVVISQISQTSAAYQAGLRQGDVIKEVNKKTVATAGEFGHIANRLSSGDSMLVFAKRGQNTFFAAFKLE